MSRTLVRVDVDDAQQVRQGLLLERPAVTDAGVVDQHIESTVRVSRVLDQGFAVQRIGDVAGDCRHAITALMDEVVEEIASPSLQQHVSPSTMQHTGELRAQARRRTCYQRDATVQAPQLVHKAPHPLKERLC
jgi:hypothetical protein